MAISILNGFDYGGQSYDFTRQGFATLEEMASYPEVYLPPLYIALCEETGLPYLYNVSNESIETYGKWRELSGGSAPELLNYFTKTETNNLLDEKVDKETGKGLSANDYTNEEKQKVQDSVDAITILNGAVTVEGSVQKQISDAIAGMDTKINMVVPELPPIADARNDVIYLVLDDSVVSSTVYDLYMVVENTSGTREYLHSGRTEIDLSGYSTVEYVDAELEKKLDIANGSTMANKAVVTDSSGNIIFVDKSALGGDAENVTYTNSSFPALTDVDKALDNILSKLYYVEPAISSFTSIPSTLTYENGAVITGGVTFAWAYNKDIVSQTLTDCTLADETVRTASYANDISSNKSFTLSASDGEKSVTKTISFQFMNKVYWGVSAEPNSYDDAWILGLANSKLASNAKGNYNFTAGTGQYCYWAIPTGMSMSVKVNGFDTDLDTEVASRSFTNASGYTTTYKIVRLHQPSLGTLTAVVS